MIRQLPVRRDGTGYAFILRNGLSPVIGRPPVIWHGRWRKQLTRRAAPQPARGPVALPPPPPGPDDLAWRDTIPQPAAVLAQVPAGRTEHAGDHAVLAAGPAPPGPEGAGMGSDRRRGMTGTEVTYDEDGCAANRDHAAPPKAEAEA